MTLSLHSLTKVFVVTACLAAVLGLGILVSNAQGAPERYIVTFDETVVNEAAQGALLAAHGTPGKALPLVNGMVVWLPDSATVSNVGVLAGVTAVEKDARVFALHHRNGHDGGPDGGSDDGTTEPTQPAEVLEWGVDRIDADLAWDASTTPGSRGTGIKVAVVDTGIDKDHKDLIANIKGGVNFVASKGGPPWARTADPDAWDDDNGHGTHVAGIVAAEDNDIGVIGVAPEAHLYGVKVLDSSGSGYISDVVSGIDWAVANGMNVINMSLGCDCDVQALHDAVDAAYAAGATLVAAAGNSGDGDGSTNDVAYPAKYSSVIAVAATDSSDGTPSWSSEGAEVEVAAPGVSIRSTWNDGLYKTISGTSMASPHAAGTVALLLGVAVPADYDADSDGAWDPAEVRAALTATADDLGGAGWDPFYGYGLIDAEESVAGIETN